MQSKLSQMTPRPLWLFKLHWGPGRNMKHLLAGNESIISKKYIFHYFSLSLFDSHLLYLKSNKGMKEGVNYKMHRLPNKRFEQPHYSQDVMYQDI